MATARITEYSMAADPVIGGSGAVMVVQLPVAPAVAHQSVSFTTATPSAAFNAETRLVRVVVDANAYMLIGDDPTATAQHEPIFADIPEWRQVRAGHKISFVTA